MDSPRWAAGRGYGGEPPATSRRHTLCLGIFLVCPTSAGAQRHPFTVLREVIAEGDLQEVDLNRNRIQLGDWEPSRRSPCTLLMSSPEFLVAYLELKGWRLSCREARHLAMVNFFESCSCERAPRSCTSAMGAARHSPPAGASGGAGTSTEFAAVPPGPATRRCWNERLWAAHPNTETEGLSVGSRAVWVTTHTATNILIAIQNEQGMACVKLRNPGLALDSSQRRSTGRARG